MEKKQIICQKCGQKSEVVPNREIWGFWKFLGFPSNVTCPKCDYKNVYPLRNRKWNIEVLIFLLILFFYSYFYPSYNDESLSVFIIIIISLISIVRDFQIREKLKESKK